VRRPAHQRINVGTALGETSRDWYSSALRDFGRLDRKHCSLSANRAPLAEG
jgi:hypothetical protein